MQEDEQTETKGMPERPLRRSKKKLIVGVLSLVIALMLLAGGAVYYLKSSKTIKDPFTATQRATIGIPLYYPSKLPGGYHIDTKSISIPQTGTVTFRIVGPGNKTIYMSEETNPGKDVVSQFTGSIVNIKNISTTLGSGITGRLDGQNMVAASITTNNKTWIIVNAKDTVPNSSINAILQNLEVSK